MQPILVSAAVEELKPIIIEQIKARIMTGGKSYKVGKIDNQGHVISVSLFGGTSVKKSIDGVNNLINDLATEMNGLGLVNACYMCATDTPIETVSYGDNVNGICASCKSTLMQEFEATIEKNAIGGNYLTGTIGAILGALVGAILWMIVSMLGFYASIVGFVMAYLSQFGYRLFKGKIQSGMPVIIIITVVLGVFVASCGEIALNLFQDPELGFTLTDSLLLAPQAFYNSELFYVRTTWINIGVALLFALFGSWNTIKAITGEAKGTKYTIENL